MRTFFGLAITAVQEAAGAILGPVPEPNRTPKAEPSWTQEKDPWKQIQNRVGCQKQVCYVLMTALQLRDNRDSSCGLQWVSELVGERGPPQYSMCREQGYGRLVLVQAQRVLEKYTRLFLQPGGQFA